MLNLSEDFIARVSQRVHDMFAKDATGHDIWHIERVVANARMLAAKSGADAGHAVTLAWLHECDDPKLQVDTDASYPHTRAILADLGMPAPDIDFMVGALKTLGFRHALAGVKPSSLEAQIVADADYLDALGAVGIARCFAYGGARGRIMFDPQILPAVGLSAEAYIKGTDPSLNHFFEKLLTLKDRMHTDAGRTEAAKRHAFMVAYLEYFFEETKADKDWRALLSSYAV